MHDVVFADAEHALAEQLGGRHQVGMDVLDAFRIAGRAGGVEPERHFVGHRVGGERRRIGGGDDVLEQMHVAAGECRLVVLDGADQDHRSQMRQPLDDGPDRLRQRRGSDQRAGAAIGEDIGVLRRH